MKEPLKPCPHPEAPCNECCTCRSQSPPVAQVEVYRRALEEIVKVEHSGIDCELGHTPPEKEIAKQALLTSKPEPVAQGHDGNCVPVRTPDDGWQCDCGYAPVAPVRKWAKEDIIGHCGQCDADVEVHHTFAEVQAALSGGGDERWVLDELKKWIKSLDKKYLDGLYYPRLYGAILEKLSDLESQASGKVKK